MKHLRLIVLSVLLSLLFTSCLADILNEQFGFTPPVILTYESNWGKKPSRTKHPSGEPLTQEELPVLSEQGWDFGGWYTDSDYNNPVTEGTILSENTKLYAKWIPRTDTPFTIHNYFMNPRENNGSYEFIYKPEYDQHLTGTTNQLVWSEYDIKYSDAYSSALDSYWPIYAFDSDDERRIKGDGSTVIYNYYYLFKIYDYEFDSMLSALQDYHSSAHFQFLESGSPGNIDFSAIKNTIDKYIKLEGTYYDENTGTYKNRYTKFVELDFGEISFTQVPAYAFYQTGPLANVCLPNTCTYIGQGAFYGCDSLAFLYIGSNDDTKTWHCSNGTNLGTYPNPNDLADFLKSNESVSLTLE